MVAVLVVVGLLVLLAPVLVSQLTSEDTTVGQATAFEAALTAAEAGAQTYQNRLDIYTNYWLYSATNPDAFANDGAMTGWESIPGTSPAESFHYVPNSGNLGASSSSQANEVLLTVTGRATVGGSTAYRTVQVAFQNQGVLSDAYYSNYEVVDPAQNSSLVTVQNGAQTTYYNEQAAPALQTGKTFWQSMCQYETWQPNTFIDGLGMADPFTGGTFSATTPYYGPFRGNAPDQSANNSVFTYTYPGTPSIGTATVTDACQPPVNFVYGETLTGRVYSNDQLWLCAIGPATGSPGGGLTLAGGLQSGIPANFSYKGGWKTQDGSLSGTNGWIDNGQIDKTNGLGTPAKNGWDSSCGAGTAAQPSFGTGGVRRKGARKLCLLSTTIYKTWRPRRVAAIRDRR